MAGSVLDDETGYLLEYRHLIKQTHHKKVWGSAFGREVGRLSQGLPDIVKGTDTLNLIFKNEIPANSFKDITYACIVCNYRPENKDLNRCRITVGNNLTNYSGDWGTPTTGVLTVKLLLNSVISTKGERFMILGISNFYLMTPLKRKEYVRMKLSDFPEKVIEHYNLREKLTPDVFVYVAIKRWMYGLLKSRIPAQTLLEKRLNAHGYQQSRFTLGLWTHEWRPICFTLGVDYFEVKYVGKDHADHLIKCIKENYDITEELEVKPYLGLTFDWNYDTRSVHLSMPNYIPDALKRSKC